MDTACDFTCSVEAGDDIAVAVNDLCVFIDAGRLTWPASLHLPALTSRLDLANYSIMTVLEIDDAQHEQEIAEQKTCDEGASDAD